MAHDEKCFELAEYFLPNEKYADKRSALAQQIQDAIEDWLSAAEIDDTD